MLEKLYAQARRALQERREALAREIGRHPRPITACDVHFNRLLEERAALTQELDRFDAFVSASPLLSADAKRAILGDGTWSVPDLGSEALEDRGDALPAADAHRD
jgi:hypothetical protein